MNAWHKCSLWSRLARHHLKKATTQDIGKDGCQMKLEVFGTFVRIYFSVFDKLVSCIAFVQVVQMGPASSLYLCIQTSWSEMINNNNVFDLRSIYNIIRIYTSVHKYKSNKISSISQLKLKSWSLISINGVAFISQIESRSVNKYI